MKAYLLVILGCAAFFDTVRADDLRLIGESNGVHYYIVMESISGPMAKRKFKVIEDFDSPKLLANKTSYLSMLNEAEINCDASMFTPISKMEYAGKKGSGSAVGMGLPLPPNATGTWKIQPGSGPDRMKAVACGTSNVNSQVGAKNNSPHIKVSGQSPGRIEDVLESCRAGIRSSLGSSFNGTESFDFASVEFRQAVKPENSGLAAALAPKTDFLYPAVIIIRNRKNGVDNLIEYNRLIWKTPFGFSCGQVN